MTVHSTNPLMTNPLDELFQTAQPAGDMTEYEAVTEGELAALQEPKSGPEKDEEDVEIDSKIDAVYDAALETFQNQMAYTEIVEPRYAARNAEVAASYLNIALNAAATRARVKGDRKKTNAFVPYANNNPNGTVVASREDIMRMIAVDAETKKV
jgi:hypothetical protein